MPLFSTASISLMMALCVNAKMLSEQAKDLLLNISMFSFDCDRVLTHVGALIMFLMTSSLPLQDLVLALELLVYGMIKECSHN